jgi:hypothetical protein
VGQFGWPRILLLCLLPIILKMIDKMINECVIRRWVIR